MPPPGGYYDIEITGGFVNNAYIDNTINLTGSSFTGFASDGETYGTRLIGERLYWWNQL